MKKAYLITISVIAGICIMIGLLINFGRIFSFQIPGIAIKDTGKQVSEESIFDEVGTRLSLTIDVSVMDVEIVRGDCLSVSYTASEKLAPKVSFSNDLLEIKQDSVHQINIGGNNKCDVRITIPSDITIEDVSIDSDVGDLNVDDLIAKTGDISMDVGDLEMNDCEFETLTVDSSVGDITLNGVKANDLEADSDVGDIEMKLPSGTKLSDYNIECKTSLGEVSVGGKNQSRSYSSNGTGGRIDLSADTGDIELD